MEKDPQLKKLMAKARGIFLVPEFGRGAFIVGGRGGRGGAGNAGAGLSIVNYSANPQASWGKGDIILWSNTKGAYAGATVSVSDVNWDDDNNMALYGRKMEPAKVLGGQVGKQMAPKLQSALPG